MKYHSASGVDTKMEYEIIAPGAKSCGKGICTAGDNRNFYLNSGCNRCIDTQLKINKTACRNGCRGASQRCCWERHGWAHSPRSEEAITQATASTKIPAYSTISEEERKKKEGHTGGVWPNSSSNNPSGDGLPEWDSRSVEWCWAWGGGGRRTAFHSMALRPRNGRRPHSQHDE